MSPRTLAHLGAWPLRNLRTLLAADQVFLFARAADGSVRLALADPPQLPSQPFMPEDASLWPGREPLLLRDTEQLQRSPVGWALAGIRGACLATAVPSSVDDDTLGIFVVWQEPHTPPSHVVAAPQAIALALREQLDFFEEASDNRHARIRFDVLLSSLQEGVIMTDEDHGTAVVNESAAILLGVPAGISDARTIADAMRELHERMGNARDVEFEAQQLFANPDGTRFNWIWEVVHPVRRTLLVNTRPVASPRHRGRLWSFHDVTTLQAAEAEQVRLVRQLARERTRLAELLARAPAMVFLLRGPEHVIEYANDAVRAANGGRLHIGHRLFRDDLTSLHGGALHEAHDRVYATGEPWRGDAIAVPGVERTGTPRDRFINVIIQPVHDGEGAVTGLFTHAIDVTTQIAAIEQLRESQKMETMGRLAGGVAHDFNNLLTVIGGTTELLLAELHPLTQAHADASEVRDAVSRASELTRQLLHFSRREVLQSHLVEFDQVVRGVQQLLRRVIGEQITLDVQLGLGTRAVEINAGHLEQVLVNLAVNARDAIAERGHLLIRTEVAVVPPPASAMGAQLSRDPHVRLLVRDNGSGMDPDTLARACEPFFTTKPHGEGTGIGLATVSGIVLAAGGCLWMESTLGVGTSVWIALPLSAGIATSASAPALPAQNRARSAGTVLLVEDEDGVRHVARRILEEAGFRVLVAVHGADGLRAWRSALERRETIDLVVTDIVMPELGGRRMLEQLRAERPELPALLMSGYVEGGLSDADLAGRTRFLNKPFTRAELVHEVDALLDSPTRRR